MPRTSAETPGEVMLAVFRRERGLARPPGWTVGLAMLALVTVVVALGFLRIDRTPSVEAGARNLARLGWWWAASAFGWITLTMLGWRLLREQARERVPWSRGAAWCVLIAACMARFAVVVHPPSLSDDVWRFVQDGSTLAAGENPFHESPEMTLRDETVADDSLRRDSAERVNNPELVTIYLPVSQAVFGAVMFVLPEDASLVQAEQTLRAVFIAFDMLAIALLLLALARAGRSPWWAALYAWHPLVLTEIAGSGHQDVIGLPLMLIAFLIAERSVKPVGRWIVPLAIAGLVKPFVVPLAGVLLQRANWRRWLSAVAIGLITTAVIAAPFFAFDRGVAAINFCETASRFSLKWAHFGIVYEPLLRITDWLMPAWTNDAQEQLARAICMGFAGVITILIWAKARSIWRGAAVMLFAFILLAPAVHPWYLLWPLVLVPRCMEPSRVVGGWAVWVASCTLPWGYIVFGDVADWHVPVWMYPLAYAPVGAAILAEWIVARRRLLQPVGVTR